ncbi:MarR family winged helix-turn-helix transcriptional regulator [Acidisphaera sp. S103]|uniref:MarR family winged helix-turn-helix transcriptional regulator n=1 Tax=Acidisphaera sp. S103 TaxID=1747223 RepID=UPI00131ABCA9|nr:MarR family winged helix-turn-helix transcriptional regulator [Acidisphaera sp. S103]
MRDPENPDTPLPETERTAAALDGYVVEDQVGFLMRRANQRHTALFADGMAAADLTPTQFTALVKVCEMGRVTQNHLGRLTAMDPATIQGVVRRLIERDLVSRTTDPLDRRTIVVAPTQAGLALTARAVVAARRITEATLEPLTADEQRQILSLLRKLG